MLYCSHFTVISVSYVVLAVNCTLYSVHGESSYCALHVWMYGGESPPSLSPPWHRHQLVPCCCVWTSESMIETLHENDVDAILITIIILCKSREVYRRAPRPPDPRWWEQEGPTGLTHPIQTTNLGFPQVEQLWNLGGLLFHKNPSQRLLLCCYFSGFLPSQDIFVVDCYTFKECV